MFIKRNDNGDTIVEVLIALAVLTFILIGAYYLASYSVEQEVQAGQRAQALELVQGQIELLKTYVTIGNSVPNAPATFCLGVTGTTITLTDESALILSPYTPTTAPIACNYDEAGPGVSTTSGNRYYTMSITETSANVFQVQANWYSDVGNAIGNITTYYRAQ